MARLAGMIELGVGPSLRGFQQELRSKLKTVRASYELPVDANLKKASAELAAFRKRQEANAINLRIEVDKDSTRRATQAIRRVESVYTRSALSKAIRINVVVVGATALPALAQGALSATAALTDLSRAALLLPGVLSGLGSTVGALAIGLRGLGDAFSAAGDNAKNSAQNAKEYARATRDLERAQRDVVQAFKDANREIQDQKDKLKQGQLSVDQANINVRRANERLAKGGFESMSDWQQAILDQKQAYLDLDIAVKENGRNIQDYYDQYTKGAAKTDTARDAVDRLATAVEDFTTAQSKATGAGDKFLEALSKLSPAAQDFVVKIRSLDGAWKNLQNSVQDNLFRGLGDDIVNLANKRLPMLQKGLGQVATGLNDIIRQGLQTIGSDRNAQALAEIFERTGRALTLAKPGIDSFINGFLQLSEVGSRFLPRLSRAFNDVMGRFEAFIDRADKDGSLEKWIDRGLNLLSSLGNSLGHIMSIAGSVTEAYEKATGNVGGFATTLEKGLGKLANWLASPEGQKSLVGYIQEAKLFLTTIKEAMPGIIDGFQTFADGAREFATIAFPLFARIGELVRDHVGLLKGVIALYIVFRTFKPLQDFLHKFWHRADAGLRAYRDNLKSAREQFALMQQEQRKAVQNQARANAALASTQLGSKAELRNAKAALALREQELAQARRRVTDVRTVIAENKRLLKSTSDMVELRKDAARAKKQYRGDVATYGADSNLTKSSHATMVARQAAVNAALADRDRVLGSLRDRYKDLEVAQNRVAKAEENVSKAQRNSAATTQRVSKEISTAQSNVESATKSAKTANDNLATSARNAAGYQGFGRLRSAIGSRGGGGIIGALGALAGAFGSVVTAIGSVGVTAGIIYALDQLTAAHDRAQAAADAHRDSEDSLASTLQKGTGAATNATLEENIRQLQSHINPVHPDDRGQDFDATKILQGQLGISVPEQAQLSLPTQVRQREERLKPADAQIVAAVPNLEEWKTWGEKYRANGVDESVYGKALNGDKPSIAKVEAARKAIYDSSVSGLAGLPFGFAVDVAKDAPEDLGTAQEQLPRTGPNGGLRGLSLGTGALRDVGDNAVSAGQREQQLGQAVPNKGLNQRGTRAFGPFVVAPNGVAIRADGTAAVTVDNSPDQAWIEGARDRGISVEPRAGGGATIVIDAQAVPNYFNPTGFRSGGFVSGGGGPRSDSIPALLSNGEFVMSAKATDFWGVEKLRAMNAPGFAPGGFIKLDTPGPFPIPPGDPSAPLVPSTQIQSPLENLTPPGMPQPALGPAPTKMVGTPQNSLLDTVLSPFNGLADWVKGFADPARVIPDASKGAQDRPNYSGPNRLLIGHRALLNTSTPAPLPPPPSAPNHSTGGAFQPGPGGVSAAPGISGSISTPHPGPLTKPTPPPTPLKPGQIPTYEQLGSASPSSLLAQLPEDLAKLTSNPASIASSLGPQDITPGLLAGVPKLFDPSKAVSGTSAAIPQWLLDLTQRFGLTAVTRPDGKTLHEAGFAVDIFDPDSPGGPSEKMDRLAEFISNNLSGQTLQLIYQGLGDKTFGIAGGTRVGPGTDSPGYYAKNWAGHRDHIHWATDVAPILGDGSALPSGGGSNYIPLPPAGGSAPPPPPPPPPGNPLQNFLDGEIEGPFGKVPVNGGDLLQNIGRIILQAIGNFFGIDLTSIFDFVDRIIKGFPDGQGNGQVPPPPAETPLPPDPGPDQTVIQNLIDQAAQAKAAGNEALARSFLKSAESYRTRNTPHVSSLLGSLSAESPKDDIAQAILSEAINRGYSRDQAIAILSTAMQESGLNPSIPGGGGAWIGIFQQDTSYPGRSDPNQNIGEFFNRLGSKGGNQGDIWKNIFWLQQRPGEKSADAAFGNGRQAYLTEIQSQLGAAQEMAARLGFKSGGFVSGPGGKKADRIPAMLSNGEFVMNAAAVQRIGKDRLSRMNMQEGGPVGWFDFPPPQSQGPLPPTQPDGVTVPNPPPGSVGEGATKSLVNEGISAGSTAVSGLLAAKRGTSSGTPGGGSSGGKKDPRGILGAAPLSQEHNLPALKSGIEGAFNTVGAIAGSAAGAAASAGVGIGSLGAAGPAAGAAGSAASQLTAAGFQMAGQVASGAANIISSLLVGTVTGGTTGEGYGAPLVPQETGSVRNFQSIHNGNIVTNNLDEYSRLRDRKDTQRALPFLNRAG